MTQAGRTGFLAHLGEVLAGIEADWGKFKGLMVAEKASYAEHVRDVIPPPLLGAFRSLRRLNFATSAAVTIAYCEMTKFSVRLQGYEPDAFARDMEHDDVRKRTDEVRVARAENVLRYRGKLVERGRVRAAGGAPESLRLLGVEHVEDEVGVGMVIDPLEAVCLEGQADGAHPLLEGGRGGRPPDRVLAHRDPV